jgi:RNA-directed DNA polymerase
VDIDLEKFFDRVNHDVLMARVARRVKDKRVLLLIRLQRSRELTHVCWPKIDPHYCGQAMSA